MRTSLVVQWLRLHASTAGSIGLIHEWGTKDPTCHAATAAKSLQLCPTLCDPIDGNPPGSAVLGILQARVLEWDAITFSGQKVKRN